MTDHAGPVAHLNWAYLVAPWGDPAVAGFTDHVDRVNAAAERSAGFIARPDLNDAVLHHTIYKPRGDFDPAREAATLSIWESAGHLRDFVYRTVHGKFVGRRAEWFVPLGRPAYVIWPISPGHVPTLAEAHGALDRLERDGPGDLAYDFAWAASRETDLA